jgi:hypothetical protein
MSDEAPRRIYLGSYELGAHAITLPREALARAEQTLNVERQRAAAERARLAQAADAERLQRTRRARALWKLGRALKVFGFGRRGR